MKSETNLDNQKTQRYIESIKNELVNNLVKRKIIRTKKVEAAFRKVNRHLFVENESLENIYGDYSIVIKKVGVMPVFSSTSPSLMARILEMAELTEGMKVLEIGTGTGYNAAIISEIVGNSKDVFTIDIEKADKAKKNLTDAGYRDITVELRDGNEGLPKYSPYDRIIATCSVIDIPTAWIKQLKDNGIIVAPLWFNGAQVTAALKKQGDKLISVSTGLGGFMPMREKTIDKMLRDFSPLESKDLLIVSEHLGLFNKDKVSSLLQTQHKEKEMSINNFRLEDLDHFLVFLALHETKSVDIYPEDDVIEKYGFERGIGIVDLEMESATLVIDKIKMVNYGNTTTNKCLTNHLKKWDDLHRPTIDKLKIFGYYKNNLPKLKKGDILFDRPSIKLVLRIQY